jgi:hypothetical protein
MQIDTALRLLGGTTISAARWIGVVDMAVRRWDRGGDGQLLPPTRDRVIAATLRKAAAKARGLSVHEWWADDPKHSQQLEDVLEVHNDAVVDLLRDLFEKSAQPQSAAA